MENKSKLWLERERKIIIKKKKTHTNFEKLNSTFNDIFCWMNCAYFELVEKRANNPDANPMERR